MIVVRDDTEKARQYAIMRRRATALLGVFAVLFVVASAVRHLYPSLSPFWLGLLRAASEAAMVGGVAYWFAVTALFRHPMGIPIPHTAIVAARKDQIGRSLGSFVSRHFLSRDVLAARLATLHISKHLAKWLATPENSHTPAQHTARALASGARMMADDDVEEKIYRALA